MKITPEINSLIDEIVLHQFQIQSCYEKLWKLKYPFKIEIKIHNSKQDYENSVNGLEQ